MTQQRRSDGSLRHLITLDGLTRPEIEGEDDAGGTIRRAVHKPEA